MKFGSKKAIFGVIWGGFEGFGPCLGNSHPTHPHLGKISQKKRFFFGSFPNPDHCTPLKYQYVSNITLYTQHSHRFSSLSYKSPHKSLALPSVASSLTISIIINIYIGSRNKSPQINLYFAWLIIIVIVHSHLRWTSNETIFIA